MEALQIQPLQIPKQSFRLPAAGTEASKARYQTVIPTAAGRRFFPSFVRERVGLRSGGISLRFLAQAKPKFSCHRLAHFTFRFPRDSYPRLFPVARWNLCIPVNLIRLRIGASVVRAGRLPLWRFLVASRLWHNFRFGTERFLNGFHHDASFSLQI